MFDRAIELRKVGLQNLPSPGWVSEITHNEQGPAQIDTEVRDGKLSPIDNNESMVCAEEDVIGVKILVHDHGPNRDFAFMSVEPVQDLKKAFQVIFCVQRPIVRNGFVEQARWVFRILVWII